MSEKNSVVAVFVSNNQTEDAVRELQKSGFDMTQLSIVGIPQNSILQYDASRKAGKFLLILHATAHEVQRAKDRLEDHTPVAEATIHAEPAAVSA